MGKVYMINRGPVLVMFICLLHCIVHSQAAINDNAMTKGLVFENFFTNNGLPDNRIRSIYQSEKGYLWIGTMNGLSRYDGYTFKQYSKRKNGEGISGNWVYAIAEDSTENVWIGTTEGLSKIITSTGKTVDYLSSEHLTHKEIRALHIDDKQQVWIGTKFGLSIYNIETGSIHKFDSKPFNNTINSIIQDHDGRIWMTCESGLIYFDTVGFDYSYIPLEVKSNPYGDKMWDIYPIEDEIWVGTGGDGILRIGSDSTVSDGNRLERLRPKKIIDNVEVFDIAQDAKGAIWLATGSGLGRVTELTDTPKVEFYNHQDNNRYSISNDKLYKLYFDSSMNLWVGSDMGLNVLLNKNLNFQNYNFDQNIIKDAVRGITSLEDNSLVFTTSSKGVYNIGVNDQGGSQILFRENRKRINYGRSITSRDEIVFVGTLDGVLIKDLSSGRESHILPSKNIFSIAKDSIESLIYIGASDGLYTYDLKKSRLVSDEPEISGFARSLHFSRDGSLWIGIDGPEIYYKQRGYDEFVQLDIPSDFHGFEINGFGIDRSDNLWIGTQSGLNKLSKGEGGILSCEFIDDNKGLIDKSVNGLVIDIDDNVWVSTIKGITKYDPERNSYEYFLPNLIFSPSSFYKQNDNSFLFGHAEGLVQFDPVKIVSGTNPPNLQITALHVSNRKVAIGEEINGDIILENNIENTEKVVLNHNNNIFTLEYADLNGNFDENRQYAYKLEGFDEDWTYNRRNQHTAKYTNLDPGNYTLQIKATDEKGVEQIKQLSIEVLSPPWKSWWAILLYILILNGIIFAFVRFRVENIKKENQLVLEKQEKEQIKNLNNQRLQFFTNISHEFRTPVTLIAGPIKDIVNDTSVSVELRQKAKIIKKNSDKLIYLIDELITFRELEKGYLTLKPQALNILQFAQETVENFQLFAEKKEVVVTCHSLLKNNVIMADPLQLYKVINNLVANALKFCPSNSVVDITVSRLAQKELSEEQLAIDSTWISIAVSDQGGGIPKAHIAHIFDRFYIGDGINVGTGIGLSLAKEIVELHKGTIKVESESRNTKFTVMLPRGKPEDVTDPVLESASIYHQTLKPEALLIAESVDIEDTYGKTFGDFDKKKVLLVDDNSELLEYLHMLLKQEYIITMASNGEAALESVNKSRPDLIVCDVLMPKMDGFTFCGIIKENPKTANIPILLLTAKTMAESKIKGLSLGANAYLDKPFDPDILKARINSILDNRNRLLKSISQSQNFEFSKLDRNPLDERFLQDVIDHINKNIENDEFSVEELSDIMAMSRSNLFRKLKQLTKMSPVEFIYYIRLQKAVQYLLERKYSMSEIAWKVGFKNPSSFSKSFKKQYGKSPSEYLSDRIKN